MRKLDPKKEVEIAIGDFCSDYIPFEDAVEILEKDLDDARIYYLPDFYDQNGECDPDDEDNLEQWIIEEMCVNTPLYEKTIKLNYRHYLNRKKIQK